MSITAGRVYTAIFVALFAVGLVWFAIAWFATDAPGWSAGLVAPVVVGIISACGLVVGVPLFSRFVEITLTSSRRDTERLLVLRRVLGPRQVVPLADLTDVVLLTNLVLPSRSGPASTPRLWARTQTGAVLGVTTRDSDVVQRLRSAGVTVTVDRDSLTPAKAARRYPGSVGTGERMVQVLPWVAIAVGVGVMVWVVGEALALAR